MSNVIKSVKVIQGNFESRVIDFNSKQEFVIEEEKDSIVNEEMDNASIREVNKILMEREKKLEYREQELNEKAEAVLKSASDSAQTILQSARMQAENIKIEAIKEGNSQGYNDGFKQGEAQIEQVKKDLEEEFKEKQALFEERASKFESEFVDLASSIIEKITGIIIEDKKDVIMHLINKAIGNCENSNSYVIRVSKEDFDYVSGFKQRLIDSLKEGVYVEIAESENLTRNKCIIETDNTVIDCSLDSQMDNLIENLKILSVI